MTAAVVQHLPVLVVLLPLAAAVALLVAGDGTTAGNGRAARTRVIGLGATVLGLCLAVALVAQAAQGGWQVVRLGGWQAPFGITLVVDRLSALMVLLTQLVALAVVLHASGGWDLRGRHFHALLQFQLMGLNGAFVTGDLFNLFVFFEVLLIASYVLLVHGQGAPRLRAGVPYVVLNLAASGLFLVGVSLLYAVTGTLNLADLAQRAAQLAGGDAVLMRSAGLLLLVVFGFKAALLPLHLWLPGTYAAAPAPVAALFAVMTKVGVYAILRVHGTVFAPEGGALGEGWLLPLALAGSVAGVVGALGAATLPRLAGWLTVASVGTVLAGAALGTQAAWSAALYYMAQSTLVTAGLFLLFELVTSQRGEAADRIAPGPQVAQPGVLGALLLLLALCVAGLPPLPAFLGKLMLMQAVEGAARPWVWAVALGSGLAAMLAIGRAGSMLFWATEPVQPAPAPARAGRLLPVLLLAGLLVALAAAAAPAKRYTDAAAAQLADRAGLADAVLGPDGRAAVRPYPPSTTSKEAP
jgi:multicomponent K+:H+ antiporter subunit D